MSSCKKKLQVKKVFRVLEKKTSGAYLLEILHTFTATFLTVIEAMLFIFLLHLFAA